MLTLLLIILFSPLVIVGAVTLLGKAARALPGARQ